MVVEYRRYKPISAMLKKTFILFFLTLFLQYCVVAQVMNISGGLQVVANKDISLVFQNGGMQNNGIFIPDSSTVYFDGNGYSALSGNALTNFFNITFKGTGNKVNEGQAAVYNALTAEESTTADADGAANNKSFTIKSTNTATAFVRPVAATANIIGNVTVERYINTPQKWQVLAVPTNSSQTIYQAWQENGSNAPGFGTAITGPTGTGFDFSSPGYSMKYINAAGSNFTMINNTGDGIASNKDGAYFVYVRGDRSNLTSSHSGNTTMRSTGPLNIHNFTPAISIPANTWKSVGNPYASPVDFVNIYGHSSLDNEFQLWDPKRPGLYTVGAYVSFSSATAVPWQPVPFSGGSFTAPNSRVESGQGFFVRRTAATGTISFVENDKTTGSRNVNRGGLEDSSNTVEDRSQLNMMVLGTTAGGQTVFLDGNATVFSTEFSRQYDQRDVDKISNGSDNFGIRDTQMNSLIIDTRPAVTAADTIHFLMNGLMYPQYQFKFFAQNFVPGLQAWLIDRFLNTETPVSLAGDTVIHNFSVNSNSLSKAAERFKIVFKQHIVVPVRFISINANRNISSNTVLVKWEIANEQNIVKYVVERSATGSGNSFTAMAETAAFNVSNYAKTDVNPFATESFYRIKAIGLNGEVLYSSIAKVNGLMGFVKVLNPIQNNRLQINFGNLEAGDYKFILYNAAGQLIFNKMVAMNNQQQSQVIPLQKLIAAGVYQLNIINQKEEIIYSDKLLVQ